MCNRECFRFWKNGKQEDWLKEKIPPSEPVSKSNLAAFNLKKDEAMKLLAKINPDVDDRLLASQPTQETKGTE